ncbi:MAG: c-type cytochrome [Deltaproteobacteria bacterium]|nr:MAG: c-type cytochrome [Deltaproteobacteria bacterium]
MKMLLAVLALVLAVVLGAVGAGMALLLRGGISAKVEPTHAEAVIARKLRSLGIPGKYRQLSNPLSISKEVIEAGRGHFADHCAVCHANDGSGQTQMGRNLYPRAPDLRLAQTQQLGDGELFYIIENGVRLTGMPGWGDGTEEGRRASWHLVHFIRHLSTLTPREKLDMEQINPKSPEEWREMQEDQEFLKGKEPANREDAHHH